MATINLTNGKALEPALTTLDVPGDKAKGWYPLSADDLGNFGAQMADLGCDEATVAALNSGVDGVLNFVEDAAGDQAEFKRESIVRFGVDENGGLAGLGMPQIKASPEGTLVCVIGDNSVPVEQDEDGQFSLGSLTGRLETDNSSEKYTSFRLRLSSKGSGDRYLVKVVVRDGVSEDEVLDSVEAGTSIAEHLKVVGQGGEAVNMATLDLGCYDVAGVKELRGGEGRPSWYVLQLVDGREVKSRSKTDAQLRTGLNVEFIRSRGNHVLLQITGKKEYGSDGKVQVDCGLIVVPPDRAQQKLAAVATPAPAAANKKVPAPKTAVAAPAAAAAAPAPAANPAAKAAAARKAKAADESVAVPPTAVNLDF